MHVPPPLQAVVNAATPMVVGPVKVELAGVAKSTWNFHSRSEFEPKFRKKLGEPAGGAVDPSRSDGNSPPKDELNWKQTCVAAAPLRIAAPSNAQAFEPAKVVPLLKMLYEM